MIHPQEVGLGMAMGQGIPALVGAPPYIGENSPPSTGMGTGMVVNFHLIPVLTSPLWEISPSPLSRLRLGKNPRPHFFLLDFSWIISCIIKVVLHKLVKL